MITLSHLSVSIEGKKILKDISYDFQPGKIYAILGPNGSGKSTLASALMGHPDYALSRASKILLGTKNIKNLTPDKRATLGISMTFQNPLALAGVSVRDLLRLALEKTTDPVALYHETTVLAKELKIRDELLARSLNDGFSGGEKKKLEALQIILLKPKFVIFDEIDTGVDVDAIKLITACLKKHLPKTSTLVFITHSAKLLNYIIPDTVMVIKEGSLVATGDKTLVATIEKKGFEHFSL